MKGVYALVIKILDDMKIDIGVKKDLQFHKGYYIYVGSAQGKGSTSLENRLKRHFSKTKKMHWHIDYLLNSHVNLEGAIYAFTENNLECTLAQELNRTIDFQWELKGFGASDCKLNCDSHLLRMMTQNDLYEVIDKTFQEISLSPKRYKNTLLE
jgi:Uri superfamily endonuclease